MKARYLRLLIFSALALANQGCSKELDKKPNNSIFAPTTPAQLQGLLDNLQVFGYGHTLGLASADEFYFSSSLFNDPKFITKTMQKIYTWQKVPFDSTEIPSDWARCYQQIFYANVVLERVNELLRSSRGDRILFGIKGDALFKRALACLHLMQLFAPAYNNSTASSDPGIPLRLKSEEETTLTRADVQTCYNQIVADLTGAKDLLQTRPDRAHRNRACAVAATGLLARVHVCMGNWSLALAEAGTAINNYDSLIDYNTINPTQETPFPADNREVIYPLKAPEKDNDNGLFAGLRVAGANVDSHLIRSYDANDLRVPLLFRQHGKTWGVRKTYAGDFIPFEGQGVAELYLIAAESNARLGNPGTALSYLKKLLLSRYKTNTPLHLPDVSQPDDLLERILSERQKELAFYGQRWADIKRLNKLGKGIIQKRLMDGQTFEMAVDDLRYALPLPEPTVQKYQLHQNPR